MKCCVDSCDNEPEVNFGNNIMIGTMPFCKHCFKSFQEHIKSREKLFEEIGYTKQKTKQFEFIKRLLLKKIPDEDSNEYDFSRSHYFTNHEIIESILEGVKDEVQS